MARWLSGLGRHVQNMPQREHTKSFWNITIQWTSHDDLTENSERIFVLANFAKQLKKIVKPECEEVY